MGIRNYLLAVSLALLIGGVLPAITVRHIAFFGLGLWAGNELFLKYKKHKGSKPKKKKINF